MPRRPRLDEARTAFNVASNALKARTAERSVIEQQVTEGNVLAPTAGRVLTVPVTTGTVILAGEPVATVAEQNFVLRLRVPERHARFLKAGDPVRIDGEELGKSGAQFGTIRLVYPQIEDGRVIADAKVAGLGDYFVGERIRVWVSAGERDQHHRAGLVHRHPLRHRLCARSHRTPIRVIDVPVQRGRRTAAAGHAGCARNPLRPQSAATCWCGRESRIVGAAHPGDDPLAADAVVPAGGARASAWSRS